MRKQTQRDNVICSNTHRFLVTKFEMEFKSQSYYISVIAESENIRERQKEGFTVYSHSYFLSYNITGMM